MSLKKSGTVPLWVLTTVIPALIITGACQNHAENVDTSKAIPEDTLTSQPTDQTRINTSDTIDETVQPKDTSSKPTSLYSKPLKIFITNLVHADGPIRVGVYTRKNKFLDVNDQLKLYEFKPCGDSCTAVIGDLPYGEYAIAAYQDTKNQGKIGKNKLGIPTDPYAFSNNYHPRIKAPNFDDCKFAYNDDSNTLHIKMIR
jgi:uncharacterized protein (DUF2141 family)